MTPMTASSLREHLLDRLTPAQATAVQSDARRLLVVAGAGSGKTEVTARRIAWQVGVNGIQKDQIVAFTFTEKAAEEMQFRIRRHLSVLTPDDAASTLGGMYVGTIHAYCLQQLRLLASDVFHNYDVLDDGARIGLVERHWYQMLGGPALEAAFRDEGLTQGHFEAVNRFLQAYDLLNEYHQLAVALPAGTPPSPGQEERDWCSQAALETVVGDGRAAQAFATTAGRFYALLHCRRFLDFSTAQAELLRLLESDDAARATLREGLAHLVVDEVQDVNPVQSELIAMLVGDDRRLTVVGDHRQAIFGWRGGRVEIMGALHDDLAGAHDGEVVELQENFRSTPRVIDIANRWATTITPPGGMSTPDMTHGRDERVDYDDSHIAFMSFLEREDEAEWIADTIAAMVQEKQGARHDEHDGERGLRHGDIAILLRAATDARTYGDALRARGIPVVFRGSDLFAQPEVLLLLAALARVAGVQQFMGRMITGYIQSALGCPPEPEPVLRGAAAELRTRGLPLEDDVEERLLALCDALNGRIYDGVAPTFRELGALRARSARPLLRPGDKPRRVFPQAILHALLEEAGVAAWDAMGPAGETYMFHIGALSSMVTSIETPGWTTPYDLRSQVKALSMWGPTGARLPEADLLTAPDAVSIGTVHSAKGLEWATVFVADVRARRFPSQRARQQTTLPFEGELRTVIDPAGLADNNNYDAERRLMYVALTRAERYLFVSCSGTQRSMFRRELEPVVAAAGGAVAAGAPGVAPRVIELRDGHRDVEAQRLVSSFSDLRYYLECPHDFYLRKVLGFAPTIDGAFGYGRGVHNLMRAVHSDPARWAALAAEPQALRTELEQLVDRGLFYLRYTTGEPKDRMQRKGVEVVADYITTYAAELERLTYEPEKEFETLLPEEQVLISGAIDVIRRDDPPRVTLIDFKSGEAASDSAMKLDSDEMRLQVSLYGIAARREMEYEPERGLVRYLAEPDPAQRELNVPLTEAALAEAANTVVTTARRIKAREFHIGPVAREHDEERGPRCGRCDFASFCGLRAGRA
ncbi:ATP-dependent DNA helicase [Micromonospora sp. WMMC241]|uniref:ATP-dependent DNA helicase n=1 Tax=Micromonospora sp. WMMC241 TaxID=3015159 RepID=UPI0022B6FC2C|nr:ATP-dependent DNA helicase [Micromonospora sp. WMMC241]MCZ7434863.1 ATP-dependent DNA helicase [Micromonospora sp. WMMC241]